MSGVMSLDIETANYSHDIGGWANTHLFNPTVVATWDGQDATVFCNHDIDVDADVRPLHPRDVGEHIMAHIEAGGAIVGHNILRFDLPVLRDALDCHAAGEVLRKHKDNLIDTAVLCRSASTDIGKAFFVALDGLCLHTLSQGKMMKSADAPRLWADGDYESVVKYCVDDARLNWQLWDHGAKTGIVKARSRWTGDVSDLRVDWAWAKDEIPIQRKHND